MQHWHISSLFFEVQIMWCALENQVSHAPGLAAPLPRPTPSVQNENKSKNKNKNVSNNTNENKNEKNKEEIKNKK